MATTHPENANLIRELYTVERVIDKDQLQGRAVNPRLFLLSSKFDLYANKKQVLKAFYKWKQLHPLLQANFVEVKKGDEVKHYVAQAPKDQVEQSNNVQFLYYHSQNNNAAEKETCWKLLYEHEFHVPIDSVANLLWRAAYVELPKSGDKFQYAFVINMHHSITDGRNAYFVVQELFKIIEDLQKGTSDKLGSRNNDIDEKRAEYELDYPNDTRAGKKAPDFEFTATDEPTIVTLVPEYLRPDGDEETFEEEKLYDGGKFSTIDGIDFLHAKDVFDKRRNSVHRMCYIDLSKETFANFTKKASEYKLKLNGCFEIIALLAWQRTVRQFSGDSALNPVVKYQVPINLRSFLNPTLDDTCMGVWISSFVPDVQIEHEESESEFWTKLFWEMARKRSEAIHAYLNEKAFFNEANLVQEQNIYHMIEKGWKAKDVFIMWAVSNIGRMAGAATDSSRDIEIFEHHEGLAYTRDFFITAAFHGIASVDGKLCWGITWNKQFLRQQVVHVWRDQMADIFTKLANI